MRAWTWLLFGVGLASALVAQGPRKLTLLEARELAVKNHPQLQAAQYVAQAAEQVTTEIRSGFFPNLFANVTGAGAMDNSRISAGGLNNPIIFNRFATGFMINQLVTDFGRTANLEESSRLRARAQRQTAQATRAQILLDVDRTYYAALRAQAVLRVAEQTVKARQLVVDQVTALGFRDQQPWELADEPLPLSPPAGLNDLINQAIRARPELAGLEFERDAAQRFAAAERNLYLPSIGGLAGAGFIPGHDDQLRGRYSAAGVNISIPVFNGRLFSARRAEAELKAQAIDQNLRDLSNRVPRDVRLAWLNATTAYERIAVTSELLNQANQALDLAQARYDLGLGSIVKLSQAQLNKTSAEIANGSARYDYQIQHAALDYQLGNLR